MPEKLEAQQQVKYDRQTSTDKLADKDVQRNMKVDEFFIVCSCSYCNGYHARRDDLNAQADDDGYDAQQTALAHAAHSQFREESHNSSGHVIRLSHVTPRRRTKLQQEKLKLNTNQQQKQVLKRIPMKYLQTIKSLKSTVIKTAVKIGFLKSKQIGTKNHTVSCLMPVSINDGPSECKEKSAANNRKEVSTNDFNIQGPSYNYVTLHRRKQYKAPNHFFSKNTAIDIFLKIKLTLKSYIDGVVVKSRKFKKFENCNHMCYDRQSVIFNYIFPYRCSSSDINQEASDGESNIPWELNASSTVILTPNSSIDYFNDQHTQYHAQRGQIGIPIIDIEPFIKNLPIFNMFRSDDVLIRPLAINSRTNDIKTLRRVTLKRPHKRRRYKSYRHNFNNKYQTYFAEVSYRNQVLELSRGCQEAVNIGSTRDCNIDFGRNPTQDNSEQYSNKNGMLPQYKCLPGVCSPGKCNSKKCLKLLKKTVPYGSHATTQSGKEICKKKKALKNKKQIEKGRETNFTENLMLNRGSVYEKRKKYACEPGVCIPGQCNANTCFQQLNHILVHSHDSLSGISQSSQASTNSRKKKLKKENPTVYKDRGSCSMQRPKLSLPMSNRQAVRIGSKCSFDIECYKSVPLKKYQCEPGVCIPAHCNANACFQELVTQGQVSRTGSSRGTSQGSQASTKLRNKIYNANNTTFYKNTGSSSMPGPKTPLHIPNRQAVRPGSKCSYDMEFYRRMRQNGYVMNRYGQEGSGIGPNPRVICEPGVCIPSKCNPNECFITLKANNRKANSFSGSSNALSQGSQATTGRNNNIRNLQDVPANFYRDRGVSSIPVNNGAPLKQRGQAVRIASKYDFSVECYKKMQQKGFVPHKHSANYFPNSYHQVNIYTPEMLYPGIKKRTMNFPNRQAVRIGSNYSFNVEFYKSLPERGTVIGQNYNNMKNSNNLNKKKRIMGVPVPCIKRICGSDSSYSDSSHASRAGQASKRHKNDIFTVNTTFYKDRGASSMPRTKRTLHIPDRQSVRIGSTCSFNIEFYKNTSRRILNKQYPEQYYLPNSEIEGKSPSGVNPSVSAFQYNRGDAILQNNKSFISRQSNKLGDTRLQDQGDSTFYRNAGTEIKKIRKQKNQGKKIIYCESGVCIPNKCDPYLCFERQRNREDISRTDTSLNDLEVTPISSGISKAANVNLEKREEAERRREAMLLHVYRNQGSSTITCNKNKEEMFQPLSTLHTPSNNKNIKQGIRIGSSCRFNIQLYKEKPLTPAQANAIRLASISPFVTETTKERYGLVSYFRNCCCKLIGKTGRNFPTSNDQSRHSQTRQGRECVPGLCNFDKCYRNDCPARLSVTDMGMGTQVRNKVDTLCYSTNAATQSRRYPLLQQAAGYERSLRSAVCKLCGRCGRNMGYGDYLNGNPIREQAVIIGSGCDFNVKFFKKRKK